MKKHSLPLALAFLGVSTLHGPAVVLYVDANSTSPVPPYSSWSTAAAVIQDAIDAAAPGDQVLVTNGLYQSGGRVIYGALTNRVALDKAVAVQSVNGPAVTVIAGNPVIGDEAVRCAYLTNGASLTGFTLTQGATRGDQGDLWLEQNGGGAWCESASATLTNCVLVANQAHHEGGGIHSGTLEGCLLYSNSVYDADISATGGGGAVNSVLDHCTLWNNSAYKQGGGASGSVLTCCTIAGNSAGQYGGGVNNSTLANCLLTTNISNDGGGAASLGTLNNCTLVGNSAAFAGGAYQGTLANCIVYYNYDTYGDYNSNSYACTLANCCTAPVFGSGNFTNAPAFVDLAHGDYHLQAGSFCINAGDNAVAAGSLDLDGNPRVVGPYVDVGAYEYQGPAPVPLSVSCVASYTNVATGHLVAFTGAIAGNATASFWDFGDGTLVTNQLSLPHTWTNAGNYTVTFTAWNDDYPAGLSARITVQVLANPTHYVAQGNPNPVAPYTSWATAATNIQDAVDVAAVAGTVWVSNGVYQTGGRTFPGDPITNRVTTTAALTLRSVNGPAVTIIKGYSGPASTNDPSSTRCIWLYSGTTLSGFTLANGCSRSTGGGIRAAGSVGPFVITNCVITGNASLAGGGGGLGGNYYNCIITGNTSATTGGGIFNGTLNNCLVLSNSAANSGGGVYQGSLTNCTVVGNYSGGGGGGALSSLLRNSIVYYNNIGTVVPGGTNIYSGSSLAYCCVTPLASGTGNFTNAPGFANPGAGDFHLLASSPCINAGDNNSVAGLGDLDGNPRIVLGKVDVGAYEFQKPVHYVGPHLTGGPVWPYTNWVTAATNIQDAVDAAAAGDFVVVTNGTYALGGRAVAGGETNRVVLTNGTTLLSVNGPQATTITGGTSTRCVYVGSNSLISGFTLSGGQTKSSYGLYQENNGGGAWCDPGGAISDCVLVGNSTTFSQGQGGGVYGGVLTRCTLTNDYAGNGGAAAAATLLNCLVVNNVAPNGPGLYQCMATNCTVAGNGARSSGAAGGGAYQSTLVQCTLVTNVTLFNASGGGADRSLLINCTLSQNRGGGGGTFLCTNYNCLFTQNAGYYGGATYGGLCFNCLMLSNNASFGSGGAYQGALYHCTVVGNVASNSNAGGGTYGSMVYNSIVYYNIAPTWSNYDGGTLVGCCTTPGLSGGAISNEPAFVDLAGGNFRLQTNSPCINSGNNTYLTNSTDLDGNPRLVAGTVDIGAYEYQSPVSGISYAWLQQYGLSITASTDTADADGDGMSNWQEWRAGTVPTNAASVLKLLSLSNDASGITVSWQSVWGKTYLVQRSADLSGQSMFITLANNIASQGLTTSWLDTTATNAGPYFYRVGVQ